jgi:hypothetical protein
MPWLLLLACSEYDVQGTKDVIGIFDTGEPLDPPIDSPPDTGTPPELCNGADDDGDGEVDEGFPDSDGDGLVDCLEQDCTTAATLAGTVSILPECVGTGSGVIVSDPWNAQIEWQYTVTAAGSSGVIVMPAVGNLTDDNGDGRIDDQDMPDIAFTSWPSNTLVALHGDNSGVIFEVSGFNGQGGVSIADVDGDGTPDVVAFTTSNAIAAVDNQGNTLWRSASFGLMGYPQPTIADLDNDGDVEVIGDIGLVEGSNGSTIATLSSPANSWRTPVAADLDQDGEQEIILANKVYDSQGNQLWTNPGTGAGNFSAVVDVDGDPEGEVFFVSGSTCYLHDDDGSMITSWTIPGSNPGPPCAADFDGDGEVEIGIPANTRISVWDVDGTELWEATINDTSGLAGCSGYDVNGDGAYEVLYADQDDFKIYDGATGTVNYSNSNHSSGTVWEYPVIADIDADGSAEIVIASNGSPWKGITVFGHSGNGWQRSGTTWGTHDFAVTNLNPDGSVPSPPEASWQKYNVFRARPAVDDPSSADLGIELIDFCVGTCLGGPAKIAFRAFNQGAVDVDAGVLATLYMIIGGVEVPFTTVTLPAIPAGTSAPSQEIVVQPWEIGDGGFVLRVDDDGYGQDAVFECDESNNFFMRGDAVCQ